MYLGTLVQPYKVWTMKRGLKVRRHYFFPIGPLTLDPPSADGKEEEPGVTTSYTTAPTGERLSILR